MRGRSSNKCEIQLHQFLNVPLRKDAIRQADRRVKRNCRKDKRAWFERKAQEAQDAANRNDTKTMYCIVRELSGSQFGRGVPIKSKDGNTLLTIEEQEKRWLEHFQETLNQPDPTSPLSFEISPAEHDIEVDMERISTAETSAAVKNLKNGKSPGLDEISAEMLKYGDQSLVTSLTSLLNACWMGSKVPEG